MNKIICEGTGCLQGVCPIHGGPDIEFENHWMMRIPKEEINKDFASFRDWITKNAWFIWQMNGGKESNGK